MEGLLTAILVVMTLLVGGATLTGNQEALCKAMGGTWTPAPPPADVCPGGQFQNIVKPAPEKKG